MSDVEVHIQLDRVTQRVGLLRQNRGRRGETTSFEYDDAWLKNSNCFSLEPALSLTPGTFHPGQDRAIFGSIGDSAPDTWGRQLMQRAERRRRSHLRRLAIVELYRHRHLHRNRLPIQRRRRVLPAL